MHVSLLRPRAASQGRRSRRGTRRRLHQGPVLPRDGSQAFEEAAGTLAVSVVCGDGEEGQEEGRGKGDARGGWRDVEEEDKRERGDDARGGVGVGGANESLWGDWRSVEDKGERGDDARGSGCNASSPQLLFAPRTLLPNDACGNSSNGSSSVCAAPSADEEEEKEEEEEDSKQRGWRRP